MVTGSLAQWWDVTLWPKYHITIKNK